MTIARTLAILSNWMQMVTALVMCATQRPAVAVAGLLFVSRFACCNKNAVNGVFKTIRV
jgi:hypothetical protein